MDTSGIHLQTQKCMQNASRERTGGPDQWNIETHTKHGRAEELGGKTGVSVGLDLSSAGRGTEAGV